jgi:hypothetical protein
MLNKVASRQSFHATATTTTATTTRDGLNIQSIKKSRGIETKYCKLAS